MARERPEVMSTRLPTDEARKLRALATARGATVSDVIRELLTPAVREGFAELAKAQKS